MELTLFNRIKFNNTPTLGTVHDERVQKDTYKWIGQDGPNNAYYFCTFRNNNLGYTQTCQVVVEIEGVSQGPFDIYGKTTAEQAINSFNS
jgi:hypothetical protein